MSIDIKNGFRELLTPEEHPYHGAMLLSEYTRKLGSAQAVELKHVSQAVV